MVCGMFLAGESVKEIAMNVEKPDGSSPSEITVRSAIDLVIAHGGWAYGVADDVHHSAMNSSPGATRVHCSSGRVR